MDSRPLRVLFVTTEVEDLAKTGGLADVGKALPQALKALGHDVRTVCPFYPQVRDTLTDRRPQSRLSLQIGDHQYLYHCHHLQVANVPVYAVDYPPYFERHGLYDNGYTAYADNGERFAFFCLAALQLAQSLDFQPDIIHCNDWHTAMLPFFLRYPLADNRYFEQTRTLLTLHNAAFQGVFELDSIPFHREFQRFLVPQMLEEGSKLNMLKCGLISADKINAVSPSYAHELLTPLGSHQLLSILDTRRQDLSGILNGCNYEAWDPATDELIFRHYTAADLRGKTDCKRALQTYLGLPQLADIPMFGMVSRISEQKGFGHLMPALQQLLQRDDLQFVIIGSGDPQFVAELTHLHQNYPNNFHFMDGYTNRIAHQVQAAADFFVMPSLYEPCGLTQMYSMSYGTLPIVRATGGLRDTVMPYRHEGDRNHATGFMYQHADSHELLTTLETALQIYQEDQPLYLQLQQNGMDTRFCWGDTARAYQALYQQMAERRH